MPRRLIRLLGVVTLAILLIADPVVHVLAQGNAPGLYAVKVNQVDTSHFPEVSVWVSIMDAQGNPVTSLPASNFALSENGQPVTITNVSHSGDQTATSVNVILAVDRSGSMQSHGKMDAAKAAATAFVDQMRPSDMTGVVTFNTQVQVVQPLTNNQAALRQAIAGIQVSGDTAMYDALLTSVDMLSNAQGRRAIILLSDGLDNRSKRTLNDISNRLNSAELSIYTIGLGDSSLGVGYVGGIDERALKAIADQSRGSYAYASDPQGLSSLYGQLSQQLQSEYRLTYTTSSALRDGVGRGIDVQVTGAGGAQAAYNPGGVIPETSAAPTWPIFGGLLLGLVALLLLPGALRNLSNSGRNIPGLRRKGRVKLTGGQPGTTQTGKPRVRVNSKAE